ncbi:MAG: tail fiber domain-containing protein [Sphingobacteriales bacterium]|nr:MAG: tail fiber domain-containing protein [Sphingobacteriales bacterium]
MNHFNNILSACFILFAFSNFLFAQSTQLINYQAIARNSSGQPLVSQNIGIRLSIHQSTAGTVQYQETHNVTTNAQGLFNVQIGNGTINAGTFSAITWTDGENKFLQIELDPDGAGVEPYTDMGTQQLVSVPYALFGAETKWVKVGSNNTKVGDSAYTLSGNANTANGRNALNSNTNGNYNTAFGSGTLSANSTGNSNVAVGTRALNSNTTQSNLVAIGDSALYNNGIGAMESFEATANTAVGSKAMFANTTGFSNTAQGSNALLNNIGGAYNVALGRSTLYLNTSGDNNTGLGALAIFSNTTGDNNTATGFSSLYRNETGEDNTAIGASSLFFNENGSDNTAAGKDALYSNTSGINNTALGWRALFTNITGSSNTAVGYSADVSNNNLTNATAIGYNAIVNAGNKVRIGNAAVTSVECQTGIWAPSDARFKFNISENVVGLDFINKLRPVTYQFDTRKFDEFLMQNMPDSIKTNRLTQQDYTPGTAILQTGFIAQEVAEAALASNYPFSGIRPPSSKCDNYSISYSQFVVPLVKAIQEQQEMIETQSKTIEQLQQKAEVVDALKAELQQIKSLLLKK